MLKARQPAVTAPANLLRLFNANARFRPVWHSPQCASASTRYAPLFHSAVFVVLGSKRVSGLKKADQNRIAHRWLNGNASVFGGGTVFTGARLNRKALIA